MKHATLFYRLLVVYVFAFLATIIFPFEGSQKTQTAEAPAKVRTASPQEALLDEEAVLMKASTATPALSDRPPALSDRVSPASAVTISH